MAKRRESGYLFPSAEDDRRRARQEEAELSSAQVASPAYQLAFDDPDFLTREELRPLRLQLELTKPELTLQEHGIERTVVIFGSARTVDMETARSHQQALEDKLAEHADDPDLQAALKRGEISLRHAAYYEQSRELAQLITRRSGCDDCPSLHVVTGGGPGVMEAANRGAHEVGGESIGLNIVLPHEQFPNRYITPELCFLFHYFAMRKMHFLLRARALVVFPGGFGTMDELFETLTLVQTRKITPMPILMFGREYWDRLINFQVMVDEGLISQEDLDIFRFVESVEEAWEIIRESLVEQEKDEGEH